MKLLACALFMLLTAPMAAFADGIAANSPRWRLEGPEARVIEHEGRQALFLRASSAMLADADFDTGVIEFDLWTDGSRGFPGIRFRGVDANNAENFYIRPHQSGNPDANQYQPVINGADSWQIFYGPEFAQPTRYRANAWMHVRLEVAADSARVYVDSDTPSLIIHDLKLERRRGFITLEDGGGGVGETGVYFANVSVTPGDVADAPPEPARALPPGLVRAFYVTPAMPSTEAFTAAASNQLRPLTWSRVDAETIGVANLARAAIAGEGRDTALARIPLQSDRARSVRMRFGFSDRVRVYLNGQLLYDGDDAYRSRDYRFLGTVGLFDALYLPLRRGRNEIVLAVSEDFGGWAAMAAFDSMDGLTLLAP